MNDCGEKNSSPFFRCNTWFLWWDTRHYYCNCKNRILSFELMKYLLLDYPYDQWCTILDKVFVLKCKVEMIVFLYLACVFVGLSDSAHFSLKTASSSLPIISKTRPAFKWYRKFFWSRLAASSYFCKALCKFDWFWSWTIGFPATCCWRCLKAYNFCT